MSKVKKVKGKMETIPTILMAMICQKEMISTTMEIMTKILMVMIRQKEVILTFLIVALIQMNGKYAEVFLLTLVKEN